jgi:hypothetical protein
MKDTAVKLAKEAAPIIREEAVGIISNFFYTKLLLVNLIVAVISFLFGIGITLLAVAIF